MKTKIKKRLSFAVFLLALLITVLFSVGKTLQYHFYADDYATLYFIQHNYPHPWLYHAYTIFFTPLYKLFGLQAQAYFALGILTFFFASLAVYFFIKILTKNSLIAILSSLIFATGYIGLDQFTRMITSSINNLNIINVSLTLLLFILWVDTRKLRFYLATVFMFWFSIAIVPFRAFPLVLFLPTVEVILSIKPEHPLRIFKKLAFIAVRYIPFLLIVYYLGISSYGSSTGDKVLTLFTPAFLKELFAILGRFVLLQPLAKFFGFFPSGTPYFKAGFTFFLAMILISLFFTKKYSRLGRCLLIVLFLTIEGYIGSLVILPSFDSDGPVNRYLTIAFLGYSAIFPVLVYFLIEEFTNLMKRKKLMLLAPVLVLPLIVIMASLSREYEQKIIIQERSMPARQFYKQLNNYLPSISGKNIFYFDRTDYAPVASRLGSIIMGAYRPKEVTLAVPYKVPLESIKIVDDFDSLVAALKDEEVDTSHIHTFYYDEKGLHQTTDKMLSLLEKGDRREIPISQEDYYLEVTNPQLEVSLSNISSLTPMVINLNLKLTPLSTSFFSFPSYGLKTQDESKREQIKEFYEKQKLDKSLIFDYLLSRKRYFNNVKVEVSSSHPTYIGKFLIEDKIETWWIADEGPWLQVDVRTWIKIDLGEEKTISRLIWYQLRDRVPSDYQISVSLDEISWKGVKSICIYEPFHQPHIKKAIENFAPVRARFVMLKINKTMNGWAPGLSEIEVIEDKYKNVDVPLALRIKQNPFEFIRGEKELQQTYDYLKRGGFLTLKTLTNKDQNISNSYNLRIPITLDGLYHEYEVPLSPRGTDLERIKLELNFPAKIEVGKMEIIHPSLKELAQ